MTDLSDKSPTGRTRLDDELHEILIKSEQPASFADHVRRKTQFQRPARRAWGSGLSVPSLARMSGGSRLVASLVVALVASSTRDTSSLLATVLAIVSVALLGSMYAGPRHGPGGPGVKQWRGRDLDLSSSPPAWVGSLRDRFRGPPRQ